MHPIDRISVIANIECTGAKNFIVESERLYLIKGGYKQFDQTVTYTQKEMEEDSPFRMAQEIVCSKYFDPKSGNILKKVQ
jgi:hypothetical protein